MSKEKINEFTKITQEAIAKFREKLLDLSNRNNLINLSFNPRSNRNIRLIDELPNQIYQKVIDNIELEIISLPSPKEYEDEQTEEFKLEFEKGKLENDIFLKKVEDLGDRFDESNKESQLILRELKDSIRIKLNLEQRIAPDTVSIEDYAKEHGIIPNYEMPFTNEEISEKHEDNKLQTLFYPLDLERKARNLRREYQRFIDEKGTNTLFLTFGCLEWYEINNTKRFSPLLIYPITLKEEKSKEGMKFKIISSESELAINLSLKKRLSRDYGIEMPDLEEGIQPENYFDLIKNTILKNKTNWKIRRYLNISIHTYSKLSMYEDLDPNIWEKNGSILGSQKNIQELFTGSEKSNHSENYYDLDDKKVFKKVPILIEDADSSQYSTILDSLSGQNLVVQGPPGTGKSTTISNIIAAHLFNGKKVLFVSEKKAALDVVAKKLQDKNLDPFTFKLTATNQKKSEFISDVKKRVNIGEGDFFQSLNNSDTESIDINYHKQADKIITYKNLLNKKNFKIDKTIYEILLSYAKFSYFENKYPTNFKNDYLIKDADKIEKNTLQKIYAEILDVTKLITGILTNYSKIENHPWYGINLSKNNLFEIQDLTSQLEELKNTCTAVIPKIKNIYKQINVEAKFSKNQIKEELFIFVDFNLKENLDIYLKNINDKEDFSNILLFCKNLSNYKTYLKNKKNLSEKIDLSFSFSKDKLKRYLRYIENSNFLSFLFDRNYKDAKNFYKSIALNGKFSKTLSKFYLKSLISYIENLPEIDEVINTIKNDHNIKKIIIDDFKEESTNLDKLQNLFEFCSDDLKSDNQKMIISKNIHNVENIKNEVRILNENILEIDKIYNKFNNKINDVFFNFKKNDNLEYEEIFKKLNSINIQDTDELNNLIQLNSYSNELNQNIKNIYNSFIDEELDFKYFNNAFDFCFYKSLAKLLFDKEKELSSISTTNFEDEVNKYKNLDYELFNRKKNQLISDLIDVEPPMGVSRGRASDITEFSLIKREIDKQRAHIPYRKLLERAPNAIRAIKPVFMLSPISLSQVTKAKDNQFDVLIIDEASQMRIEDALGAILRCKQIIIVGDPEQLPPSSFFDSKTSFEDNDIVEDDESILDLAISKFGNKRMLRWHYRSRHESLINFSNHYFYDRGLIIPPSSIDKFAVNYNFVKGTYNARTKESNNEVRGGINPIESDAISSAVINFMEENPSKSCLVVTMNNQQRDLIDETIRSKSHNNSIVSDYISDWQETMEPFTVKNLETVQGDERDFIFISTLFGPNKDGNVMQRFGPINNVKGHRRLNVLFTRAKESVQLFTSLKPNDIKADNNTEKGRMIFQKYIEYASTQKIETGKITGKGTDSDFEDWVKEELENLGYEVTPQVGVSGFFIDLGIKHKDYPFGYLAGVECDGATYHSSLSARDNDITRQKVLENYGWNIYRIWSTNWFNDSKTELRKLDSYLKSIIKNKIN